MQQRLRGIRTAVLCAAAFAGVVIVIGIMAALTNQAVVDAATTTPSNMIDFRLNPSYMSGWEVFHLNDSQNAVTPFPALYWPGGGSAPAGSYPYQSLGGGLGGYRGIRYDASGANGLVKSDTGVWTNAGATRYCCVRKRIELTGTPRNAVSVSISGHVDDDLHVFVRNAAGQVSPLFRDNGTANNFSGSATFNTLKSGTNWIEVYATDAVFSGTNTKRHVYIAMSPIAVPVAP